MMDWVGTFNAYNSKHAKCKGNGGSIKRKVSNKTPGTRVGSMAVTSSGVPKSQSSATLTLFKSSSFTSKEKAKPVPGAIATNTMRRNNTTSVLSRDNREGIYRYELSQPVSRLGTVVVSTTVTAVEPATGTTITTTTSTDTSKNNNLQRSTRNRKIPVADENKRNSFLRFFQVFRSKSVSISLPNSGSSSVPHRKKDGVIPPRSTPILNAHQQENQSLRMTSPAENLLKEPLQDPAADENGAYICTCLLEEQEQEELVEIAGLEDKLNTAGDIVKEQVQEFRPEMPRNSNYNVHPPIQPQFRPTPFSGVNNSTRPLPQPLSQRCRIHSNQNGFPKHDYNQNLNGNLPHHQEYRHHHRHHHQHLHNNQHHQRLINLPINDSYNTDTIVNQYAIQPTEKEKKPCKKEFIPSFVLIDAVKSGNERKIYELVKKLSVLNSDEVAPVANFQDQAGRTPLSYICSNGNVMMVEELSKLRGLSPNLADVEGNTPLHHAAQAGHSEVVDLMLTRFHGVVDPNCRNGTGLTPLMKAALQGRTRCTKSLIGAGASPLLRDYSRQLTAEGWARLCGRHICAEVIVKSTKDYLKSHPKSPVETGAFRSADNIRQSRSNIELKRMNSDESPYLQLYNARSAVSGASWLKNKIKKAIGVTPSGSLTNTRSTTLECPLDATTAGGSSSNRSTPGTYAIVANLSNAAICTSSVLLPSIKPLLDDKQKQIPKPLKKMHIPAVQVTTVKK